MRSRLASLPLPVLEDLSKALLNFMALADLEGWLAERESCDRIKQYGEYKIAIALLLVKCDRNLLKV